MSSEIQFSGIYTGRQAVLGIHCMVATNCDSIVDSCGFAADLAFVNKLMI